MKIGIIMPEKQKQSPRHLIYLSVHIACISSNERPFVSGTIIQVNRNAMADMLAKKKNVPANNNHNLFIN
jgi:hypothetical protein